jgi:hypothetical protein
VPRVAPLPFAANVIRPPPSRPVPPKRAITAEEHSAIVLREQNSERRDFYELLWLTGAAQSDGACLRAEDINWQTKTICFTRKKLKSRGKCIKPTLFRFSADIEAILKRRPTEGQLFPISARFAPEIGQLNSNNAVPDWEFPA